MISDHLLDNISNNSSSVDAAADVGEVIPAQGGCVSQEVYIDSGNDKKVLHLLSIGLTADNNDKEPLFSFDREPWSVLAKTSVIRPRNTDYVNEIVRRANLFHIVPLPRPSNWTRERTLEWLDRNPVRDEVDIEFLRNEVVRLRNVLERRRNEQDVPIGVGGNGNGSVGGSAGGRRGNWRGCVPYLRVIMCLTQDNVKSLFLTRAGSLSRQQLDARNSENRPLNVFEVIAELWNDSSFNPVAPASDCHLDFQMATDCSHELVAGLLLATPQKIEDCLASMRSELIRIIDRWERSGQGEGGRDQEEDQVDEDNQDNDDASATSSISSGDNDSSPRRPRNYGSLDRRTPRALQSRAAFLNGKPSYLLYYWEIIDAHQLLRSSVQRLTNNIGAGDASMAPTVTTASHSRQQGRRRRQHQQEEQQEEERGAAYTAIMESLKDIAKGNEQLRIDREQDRLHERQLEEQRIESDRNEQCRHRVFQRRTELLDLGRKYRKLNAELDMSNERSQRLSEFYANECRLVEEELQQLLDDDSTSRR